MCDIGDLHNTLSQTMYDDLLNIVISKWKNDKELSEFAKYFERQWINTCTCHKYFDKGICKNLVAACLQVKVSLPGLEQSPKKFIVLRRKKRNQYRDISGDEKDLAIEQERPLVQMPIVESLHQETVEASQAEVLETEI